MATASDDFSSYTNNTALNGAWTQDFATSGNNVIKGPNGGNSVQSAGQNWAYVHRNDISPGGAQYSRIYVSELFQGGYNRLAVRMSGANGTLAGYVVEFAPDSTSGSIRRMSGGSDAATLKNITFPHAITQEYIELRASGTTISVYQADVLVDSTTDATIATGNVGFGQNNGGANSATYGQLTNWSGGDISTGVSIPVFQNHRLRH